jgi:hypothetical protein
MLMGRICRGEIGKILVEISRQTGKLEVGNESSKCEYSELNARYFNNIHIDFSLCLKENLNIKGNIINFSILNI